MRKKMLLLTLAMASLAGALTSGASAVGTTSCPQCTYYSDGSKCCVSCWCQNGIPVACTDHYCPPEGGID